MFLLDPPFQTNIRCVNISGLQTISGTDSEFLAPLYGVNKKQEDVPLTTSGCEWVKKLNPGLPMKTVLRRKKAQRTELL